MSSVRVFQLRHRKGKALKVQRLELPSALADRGARLIRFSPDRKWLLIVDSDNTPRLFRILEGYGQNEEPSVVEKIVSLSRLHRPVAKTDYRHGTLGEYDRTICRVAFSHDSRLLAVGDLSGYIDTWVLEGHEDLTQGIDEAVDGINKTDRSDDEESEGDEEDHPSVLFGQHWIRNPAAALIPKLRAAVLVLTFRPSIVTPSHLITNGNIALHPTRHNPHPHSHDIPKGEDRLFAVTSEHHIYEFEIFAGRLSDWSRRNPTSSLPEKFRDTRERAMGAIWDVGRDQQRIWLYGSTWLWMFDLSKDIPPLLEQRLDETTSGPSHGQKRKRRVQEDHIPNSSQKVRGHDSGAGSRVPDTESTSGLKRKMRKITGARATDAEEFDLAPQQDLASEEDNDDDKALIRLRRGVEGRAFVNGGPAATHNETQTNGTTDVVPETDGKGLQPAYWCTYTYRSILGIMPLNREGSGAEDQGPRTSEDDAGDGNDRLEVALIERPLEEVDLPPRYHGDQEWHEGT